MTIAHISALRESSTGGMQTMQSQKMMKKGTKMIWSQIFFVNLQLNNRYADDLAIYY